MPDFLILSGQYLFAWALITAMLSWLLALFYPLSRKALALATCHVKAFYTLAYGLLSPLTAVFVLLVLMQPELADSLVPEHCHGDDCSPHSPALSATGKLNQLLVICVVAGIFWVVLGLVQQLLKGRQQRVFLETFSHSPAPSGYKVIESSSLLAWCSGLLTPQIFLSSALINTLSEQHLKVVLAHEFSHQYRRDNLRQWLLHWATLIWPRRMRNSIRSDLKNSHDTLADLAALAMATKNSAMVETLNRFSNNPATETEAKTRVAWLEKEQHKRTARLPVFSQTLMLSAFFAAWMGLVIFTTYSAHPLLELLVQ